MSTASGSTLSTLLFALAFVFLGLTIDETQKLGEMLAALRNAFQGATEAIEAYINFLGKPLEPPQQKTLTWDPNKINWSQETGQKGSYERYPAKDKKAESTDDYKNMLQDLKNHKGAFNRNGFFYWVFTDQATVGRRQKQGKP